MSRSILCTLDRAIKVRRNHGAWYASFAQDCDQHTHFINVLEEVKHILQPLVPPTTRSAHVEAGKVTESDSNDDELRSRFEPLSLDADEDGDILSTIDESPDIQDCLESTNTHVSMDLEEETFETYFAVSCFFEDLDKLLTFVSQVWLDYSEGHLHIIPASITVNTAIDLAHNFEEELLKIVPKSCAEIVRMHYEACCQSSNKDPNLKQEPEDLFNFEAYDQAERSFLTISSILSSCPTIFRDYFASDEFETFSTSLYGSNCERYSNRESYHFNKIILIDHFDILNYMMHALLPSGTAPIHDDFTRASIDWMFFQDRKPTLWMLFAAKAHLRSRHVLGSNIGRGCHDLYQAGLTMSCSLREQMKFYECREIPHCKDKSMEAAKYTIAGIKSWATSAGETKQRFCSVSYT